MTRDRPRYRFVLLVTSLEPETASMVPNPPAPTRLHFGGTLGCVVLVCAAWAAGCSTDRSVGEVLPSLRQSPPADAANETVGSTGTAGDGVGTCAPHAAPCTKSVDCCSRFCIDGACVDPNVCSKPEVECSKSSSCCSGRCVQESTGSEMECSEYCFVDGVACSEAYDCCSLGCFGGVCGGGLCHVRGETCTANAECCSNVCIAGTCDLNPAALCREPGDVCTSDPGGGCCYGCDAATQRCKIDPNQCRAQGAPCASDANCCKGVCLPNASGAYVCQIPCHGDGSSCGQDAECCSFNCTGSPSTCRAPGSGTTDASILASCGVTGSRCGAGSQCCSRFCSGGFCDLPCRLTGITCAAGPDCCSGLCAGTCQETPPR